MFRFYSKALNVSFIPLSGVLLPKKYGQKEPHTSKVYRCAKDGLRKSRTVVKKSSLKKKADFQKIWKRLLAKNSQVKVTQPSAASNEEGAPVAFGISKKLESSDPDAQRGVLHTLWGGSLFDDCQAPSITDGWGADDEGEESEEEEGKEKDDAEVVGGENEAAPAELALKMTAREVAVALINQTLQDNDEWMLLTFGSVEDLKRLEVKEVKKREKSVAKLRGAGIQNKLRLKDGADQCNVDENDNINTMISEQAERIQCTEFAAKFVEAMIAEDEEDENGDVEEVGGAADKTDEFLQSPETLMVLMTTLTNAGITCVKASHFITLALSRQSDSLVRNGEIVVLVKTLGSDPMPGRFTLECISEESRVEVQEGFSPPSYYSISTTLVYIMIPWFLFHFKSPF